MYGLPVSSCFHCGEALPPAPVVARIDAQARAFCCAGCASASAWICDADLGDYYRLRSAAAVRVDADAASDDAVWDRDDMLATHSVAIDGGREITLVTDGMRCAACAWLIDRALQRQTGVLDVSANAITGRLRIGWDPAQVQLSALVARLSGLGYRVYLAGGEARERERRRERNRWLMRLGVAGLGAMQAMMFSEALYLDFSQQMPTATRDFFRWIAFLLSTPVVFFAGWPFLAGMVRELRGRAPGMDTLIGGSTLIAYGASLIETLRGGPHVWFDAAVMFVFLLLIARGLEQGARALASARVDALARARPALATRERVEGGRERVALADIRVADIVFVAAGEAVPADGVLLEDAACFDEALLTGESAAVQHVSGDTVLAGSVCRAQSARVRVSRVGADTWLSQLTRLVEHAQAARPAMARVAERVSGVFVMALALATVVVFFWWRQHDPSRAVEVAIALLVVSCPCALSLAIPAALGTAHGALARLGVLSLRGDALGALARVDHVVFDKTGTLGDGAPAIVACTTFASLDDAAVRRIAATLEADSRHPLARAFAADLPAHPATVTDRRELQGEGLEGHIDGERWRIGRLQFASGDVPARHPQDGEPATDDAGLWLGNSSGLVAHFDIRELPRQDAAAALAQLRRDHITVQLCSGDAEATVRGFADGLKIDNALSRCTPSDKLAHVQALQARGRVVLMVGDGINDAPVLAGADVSMAVGEGAALAHAAADFVITAPSLLRVPQAIALARRTRRILRQNLAWAIGYNIIALPLAATGHVTPWLAALGMAGSSLIVTANALRLLRGAA